MARKARFPLTLTQPAETIVTANYETAPGSAVEGPDYTHVSGTVSYAPGEIVKYVFVPVRPSDVGKPEVTFHLLASGAVNITIDDESGLCTLPGEASIDRFAWMYARLHDNANGYFGPQTGPDAFKVPRHVPEIDSRIINEAPDYGGETVSETASFWVGLETWRGKLYGDWAPYNNSFTQIEKYYIPQPNEQPVDVYDNNKAASFVPEAFSPNLYPGLLDFDVPVGCDPLYDELVATYGNKHVYLMHWIIDVEGAYGFHNQDGATFNVKINTFERSIQESSYETVTHGCWNDWENGGNDFGFEPLYVKGNVPVGYAGSDLGYPEAPNFWAPKYGYTNAPDAEARVIQWAFFANKFATAQSKLTQISGTQTKIKKMGDYLRYNLFDKYFRKIGTDVNTEAANFTDADGPYASCHYLINWYCAWGGDAGLTAPGSFQYSYRVGSSDAHQGYQCVTAAYAMATGGGGMVPLSGSAGDTWKGSLYRQIEMIRWLQSPEGPIAGGVTNSYNAQYMSPSDGRETKTFYGMLYNYSPVYHDPPSNDWVGFQVWGHGRTADLFLECASATTPLAVEIRPNLEIIMDRLVNWFMNNSTVDMVAHTFLIPTTLRWGTSSAVSGQTATAPNLEGLYEYIPSMTWPGTGTPDYAAFWNASTVPNPNLHCLIHSYSHDVGLGGSLAYMLTCYAQGKRILGKFDAVIPNGTHTARQVFQLAADILDCIWITYRDTKGVCVPEQRADYKRMGEEVYVPTQFHGTMPNGDPVENGATFVSVRSFLMDDPKWPEVQAYIDNPTTVPPPTFTYHRFWNQVDCAIAFAAIRTYFNDLTYSTVEDLPLTS